MGTVILYICQSGPEGTIDFQNDSDLPIALLGTYASEPQRRVRDFCVSLSDLSELRRALNFPSRAGNL